MYSKTRTRIQINIVREMYIYVLVCSISNHCRLTDTTRVLTNNSSRTLVGRVGVEPTTLNRGTELQSVAFADSLPTHRPTAPKHSAGRLVGDKGVEPLCLFQHMGLNHASIPIRVIPVIWSIYISLMNRPDSVFYFLQNTIEGFTIRAYSEWTLQEVSHLMEILILLQKYFGLSLNLLTLCRIWTYTFRQSLMFYRLNYQCVCNLPSSYI